MARENEWLPLISKSLSIYCAFCQTHCLIFCRYFMIKYAKNKSGNLNKDRLPLESLDWASQFKITGSLSDDDVNDKARKQ